MRGIRCIVLALGAALALSIPQPTLAQWMQPGDSVPEIAAARKAVFDAPFNEKSLYSEELLELIAAEFGEDSLIYSRELQLHSDNLVQAGKGLEAQQAAERALGIVQALPQVEPEHIAFAQKQLAKMYSFNGFAERAVEAFRPYLAHVGDEAYECGRVTEFIVKGCALDVIGFASVLHEFATMLVEIGKTEEATRLFRQELARFDAKWADCDSATWRIDCADIERRSSSFRTTFADFLAQIGDQPGELAVRREVVMPRLSRLAECSSEGCEADFWLSQAYAEFVEDLYREDLDQGLELDRAWLVTLFRQPIYGRGKREGAEYFDRQYAETMDKILENFARQASLREVGLARSVLVPLGREDLIEQNRKEANAAVRLAFLRTELDALGSFDYGARADVQRRIVAEIESQSGPDSVAYAEALRDLGLSLRFTDRHDETEDAFRQSIAAYRRANGIGHSNSWFALHWLVDLLVDLDRPADAIAALEPVVLAPENDHREIYAGPAARRTGGISFLDPDEQLNRLKADYAALMLQQGGDPAKALDAASHAAIGMLSWRQALGFSRSDEAALQMQQQEYGATFGDRRYREFFSLWADAMWVGTPDRKTSTTDAFLALQVATMDSTSRAVAQAAAQRALEDGDVAELVQERDRIDAEIVELLHQVGVRQPAASNSGATDLDSVPDNSTAALARLDAEYQQQQRRLYSEVARLEFAREELNQQIMAAAPGYFELIRPQALDLAEAQQLLGPDEAFLIVVPTEFGTHSLAVSRTAINWHRSDLAEDRLNQHVRRLLWDVGGSIAVSDEELLEWSEEGEGEFPFDRSTAHLMYRELVAPHTQVLAGKRHLFVAASGALSSLPFSIFVTQEPSGDDGEPDVLRATPWLGDAHAIVQLPSLQSLKLLRAVERSGGNAEELLLGFGDPVLGGGAVERGTGANQRRTRASGMPIRQGFSAFSNGEKRLADPENLRKLSRLPGTRRELEAMSKVFGQARSAIFLAEDATETQFRKADLARASVISFATHGLVAGEVDGIVEPGLVFTPPDVADDENDGLLTASEVTGLSLDADWVILSACNTASGDGSDGAPGLSGLSRSFFFAGAKSLLASHWPVKDAVASIMTVRILELQKANPALSRAEALQAAMREIREDERDDGDSTWAHPSAWAPFAYIGDVR